jgi:CRP-like cAMP-binding protein
VSNSSASPANEVTNQVAAGSLVGIQLLADLDESAHKTLAQKCGWRIWKRGEEILNRESADRDVYFVVQGSVRIVNYSLSGREVAYATVQNGGYFGELSAIDGEPRSATVVALDNCILASLAPEQFREILIAHPTIAVSVLEKLASIVRTCDDRIMDLATLSAYQRVYCEILDMKKEDPVTPDSWLIYPLPTQAQIAAKASTTRETVARVLSQLASSGIAERKSKTLYIRDLIKLEKLAERLNAQEEAAAPPQ